ncbi:hypothetical protein QD228_04295 [Cobetia sp. 3AK]|uniref:mobilome CxxCx(11)CxxC protein n=1 Tax=Cobetia sp. 3AK TaxID=3040020 RepID=UPI00244A4C7D|nr:mobilome CxxCx(11)CxxC protein [Cobetia sp. 3AK]MDH2373055.1 hypothetical protein [Cobetia sp. 3AK]
MTLPEASYKEKCEEVIFYSFGTIFILKNKKKKYSKITTIILLLGIIVPILSYSLLLISDSDSLQTTEALKLLFYILGIIQVVASVISLAYKWEDKKTHADKAIEKNLELHNKAKDLQDSDISTTKQEIIRLWNDYNHQEKLDIGVISVSRKEEKSAMSHTLYNLSLNCAKCDRTPPRASLPYFGCKCDCCGQKIKGRL